MLSEVLTHYGADLSHTPEHGWRSIKCPFHEDRTASARVNLDIGGFACLAGHCAIKGDALKLIQIKEGLDYQGAKQWAEEVLGQSFGDIPRSAPKPRQKSRWRQTLFDGARDS